MSVRREMEKEEADQISLLVNSKIKSIHPDSIGESQSQPTMTRQLHSTFTDGAAFKSMSAVYDGAALGLTLDCFDLTKSSKTRKKLKKKLTTVTSMNVEVGKFIKDDVKMWMEKYRQRGNGGFCY